MVIHVCHTMNEIPRDVQLYLYVGTVEDAVRKHEAKHREPVQVVYVFGKTIYIGVTQ